MVYEAGGVGADLVPAAPLDQSLPPPPLNLDGLDAPGTSSAAQISPPLAPTNVESSTNSSKTALEAKIEAHRFMEPVNEVLEDVPAFWARRQARTAKVYDKPSEEDLIDHTWLVSSRASAN